MGIQPTDPLRRFLRQLVETQQCEQISDKELLQRFAMERDEAAFTTLVRRHVSLVRCISRRVLGNSVNAEEVCQATFLVLARKAGSHRWQASVVNWLYKVALRLACKAKEADLLQRSRESQVVPRSVADPVTELTLREAEAALDEELMRLPESLRSPVILHYLEGQKRAKAAQQLGCSTATLDRRLARALELLRSRLARRGVTLSTVLLTVVKTNDALAAVPSALLVGPTVRAAMAFAGSLDGLEAVISTQAAALAEGVLQAMVLTKMKMVAVVLAVMMMAGTGSALVYQRLTRPAVGKVSPADLPAVGKKMPPAGQEQVSVDVHGDALPSGAVARMGTLRRRHGGYVSHVEYLPDGKSMLTVGQDRMARLWDASTGKLLRQFRVASESAFNFALSRNGNLLAMSGKEPVIYLYDVSSGKRLHKLQIPKSDSNFAALIFTPDSQALVAAASTSTIHVWETATGKELRQLGGKPFRPGAIIGPWRQGTFSDFRDALAFADDGKTLLWAGGFLEGENQGRKKLIVTIRMWDFASGEERHQHKLFSNRPGGYHPMVAFSPDGKMLAWLAFEKRGVANFMGQQIDVEGAVIHLFHVVTGHEIRKILDFDFTVRGLAFSHNGKLIVARGSKYHQLKLWDVATGKQRGQIEAPTKARRIFGEADLPRPSSVAFSVDSKVLAVGGESSIGLLDVVNGKELHSGDGHQWTVSQVRFSPESMTVVSQSEDETVREWDTRTGKEIRRIASMEGKRTFPVFSRDGRMAAAIVFLPNNHLNNDIPIEIRVWNTDTNKDIRHISIDDGYCDAPSFLALSPDGKWLALHRKFYIDNDGKRLQSKTLVYDLTKNREPTYVFSVDNSREPTADDRCPPVGIIFSPDSQLLAVPFSFNDHVLRIWNVTTGKQRCQIEVSDKYSIRSMAFAPDGQSIALDLGNDRLSIWDAATGQERRQMNRKYLSDGLSDKMAFLYPRFFRPRPTVSQLAFSPDGGVLVEGRADGTIGIWDAATGEDIGVLRGHQGSVQTVAFASDGKTLASGSMDSTILLWDMTRWTQRRKMLQRDLSDRDLESQWKNLANPDQSKAYQAVLALAADPSRAAHFLGKRIHPVEAAVTSRVHSLIRDLDSDKYTVRTKASNALAHEGEGAVPLLRLALKDKTLSLETHRRLQEILTTLAKWPVTGERLRHLWAVEALELMGTPEAKQVLHTLAKGVPDSTLTRASHAALKRLDH